MGDVLCLNAILSQEDGEFFGAEDDEWWLTIGFDDQAIGREQPFIEPAEIF